MKEPPFVVAREVAAALAAGLPVVALETTLVTHGLPQPHGLRVAESLETAVRERRGMGAAAIQEGVLAGLEAFRGATPAFDDTALLTAAFR